MTKHRKKNSHKITILIPDELIKSRWVLDLALFGIHRLFTSSSHKKTKRTSKKVKEIPLELTNR